MAKKGLMTLVAAALSAVLGSGCYVQQSHGYLRIDTPKPESGIVEPRRQHHLPERRTQPTVPMYGNCITYSAPSGTVIDNGNGEKYVLENTKEVQICTCYDRVDPVTFAPDPRSGYACKMTVR